MKLLLSALGATVIMVSCTSKTPKTEVAGVQTVTTDTTGLAQFQAQKKQQEFNTMMAAYQASNMAAQPQAQTATRVVYRNAPARSSRSYSSARRSSGNSMTSESNNTALRKKGWSKAAKGAVIGGVGGAAAGAIINKRNRGAGAVVGGVIGAGGGYVIGRGMDKRDGRY